MTNKDLADLIFPSIDKDIEYYENLYKPRDLKEGACVTRFSPSPTGFFHLGGLYSAVVDKLIAHNTGGVFFLRNEDTDKKREVEGAVELIMDTLNKYGLTPDEYEYNGEVVGNYGPYIQSERKEIYHTFLKHLVEIGRAYPCFSTEEELGQLREVQEKNKLRTGYYGRYAKYRDLPIDEAISRIKNGDTYVLRFKSMGDFERKFKFMDEVRGMLYLSENDQDIVVMKSDNKLPTYHFAHFVDDYLMRTTHVVRGEEWLPSAPIHVELFNAFGKEPPKYVHTPLIVKKEGNSVRKLSKRKDPEATMTYYEENGYPTEAVIESLMVIINSNYEQWHDANPDKNYLDFEFSPKKMSATGGALYDIEKLNNISKNFISKLKAEEVYDRVLNWSSKYDKEFYELMSSNKEFTIGIFSIERDQEKPRKDFENYKCVKGQIWYMYDSLFNENKDDYEFMKINDKEEIKNILTTYLDSYIDLSDKEVWFNKIKDMCDALGYASNMKDYKQNPDNYKGNVADVSTVLRVALTKKSQTPDLYELMKLLGVDKIKERYDMVI